MMSANVFVNRDKDSMTKSDTVAPEPEGMIDELKKDQGNKGASPAKMIAKASANKAAKQRKRKREKKPYRRNKKPLDMPKRPLSAYNFFFREHREIILDERDAEEEAAEATGLPPSSHTGRSLFESMGKEIASRWKALSDQGHEKYTKLAEEDAGRYRREMVGYSSTQAASIRSAIVSESLQEKEKKQPPKLKESPLIGNSGPGLTEPPNLKVDAWLQTVRGGSPPQPPQQPSIEDMAAFSPKSRLAAYHALQHQQQLTNHQSPLGASSHSQALMDVDGLQFHHPSLFSSLRGADGGGSSGGGLHQNSGLPSNVGSIQAQVNLQNQILAEELASHQARLVQGRLLEAQLSRMQQQQQGSSSFQYPPAPAPPPTALNQFMQQQNRDYGDYATPAGLYGLGSNVNLDRDGAFAAALRGAHQATSSGSSLLPSPFQSGSFQSGSLESDYSRYLRSAAISSAVNQNPYSSGAGGVSGSNFPSRDGGYNMP
jgi:hypothetical protein